MELGGGCCLLFRTQVTTSSADPNTVESAQVSLKPLLSLIVQGDTSKA